MSASLGLPQLKKKYLPEVTGTTHRGLARGRVERSLSLSPTLHSSVESPCLWRPHGIALMPSFFLCPICFLLSHINKHWSETILGWTLHADYLNISFHLTTLWHLYSPGPLGLNFLLTLLTASCLYKPRLTKKEEIHPPHPFPQVSWKTGSFYFLWQWLALCLESSWDHLGREMGFKGKQLSGPGKLFELCIWNSLLWNPQCIADLLWGLNDAVGVRMLMYHDAWCVNMYSTRICATLLFFYVWGSLLTNWQFIFIFLINL